MNKAKPFEISKWVVWEAYPILGQLDRALTRWAMRKFKKLHGHQRRATHWLGRIARRESNLFAHWRLGVRPAAG